jgi:hypothetical protein
MNAASLHHDDGQFQKFKTWSHTDIHLINFVAKNCEEARSLRPTDILFS